jgi:nucleoside-triphosphatase THEP1
LFADVVLLIFSLALLNYVDAIWWSSFILAVSVVWSLRYKRALRQLTKPGFWLFFAAITMITAFVFSKVQGQGWQEGMLIGLQMNFRAVVVVLGFSVLGTELYNPGIRSFFLKTSFKQLPAALELSFASLPQMIARIPDFKSVMKNPVSVIYQIVAYGEERLEEIKCGMKSLPRVYIISGALGGGKTTFAQIVADILIANKCRVGGFFSVRLTEADVTVGYDLQDLATNESVKFLRLVTEEATDKIGRFEICREGVEKGNEILDHSLNSRLDLVVIDEVGRLELRGDGWVQSIQNLLESSGNALLITVRDGLELEVINKLQLMDYQIVHVGVTDPVHLAERILNSFK